MFDDLAVTNEHEFAGRLDELMKRGDYEAMQELAESKAPDELSHAATHAMLCNVWRELNDADKLALHRKLGNECPDITEDLRKNMSRELMVLCDKRGIYGTADGLWTEISTGRRDPAQHIVDTIGRAKCLYYRTHGTEKAKIMIADASTLLLHLSRDQLIEQDILNQRWWGMQICTATGDHSIALRYAKELAEGSEFGGLHINPDPKPTRQQLARIMLTLDHKPSWFFATLRRFIIRLARRWDMRH